MEGLEIVARESLTRIDARFSDDQARRDDSSRSSEAAYAYFSDIMHLDEDERNWSVPYLRRQLQLKDSGRLFRRYQIRVQHALFVELLLMNIVVNAIMLVMTSANVLLHGDFSSEDSLLTFRICRGISTGINLVLFFTALFRERWFNHSWALRTVTACITLGTMTLSEFGPTVFHADNRGEHQELSAFYIVVSSAVLLPFSRKLHGAIAAVCVITFDLTLTFFKSYCEHYKSALHLFREGFYLTVALFTGLCIRYVMEVMGRRSFLDRRECLESKIKCEDEKEREERLLHSVLPLHIAKEFREDFRSLARKIIESRLQPHPLNGTLERRQPFKKLYVERHSKVSILYADIVNSMLLCASLQVADLVDTLDDLFGRFDRVAEANNCMRIKLLGDCYYCVAGLPVPDRVTEETSHHADDCVRTGILMILIIRQVREKRGIDVDMRIGVHSGRILGGILGLKKWQYDVWSRDVTIASHMEQSGFPGHVHITKETLDFLTEYYEEILPGNGQLRDDYIAQEGIQTYLVTPVKGNYRNLSVVEKESLNFHRRSFALDEDWSVINGLISNSRLSQEYPLGFPKRRRRAVLDYSLVDFREIIDKVNVKMGKAIERMHLGKKDQWCSSVGVNPIFLTFREWRRLELRFLKQPDPLFKYYLASSLFLFVGIVVLQLTTIKESLIVERFTSANETNSTSGNKQKTDTPTWTMHGVTFIFLFLICFLSWVGYIHQLIKEDDNLDVSLERQSRFKKLSRYVWKLTSIRLFLWGSISFLILACSLVGLHVNLRPGISETYFSTSTENLKCEPIQWLHTACITLALTVTSVFVRMHYLLKLVFKLIGLAIFCSLQRSYNGGIEDEAGHHCFFLGLVIVVLHMLDRQIEYVCRLDYVWRWKLNQEQEEANTFEMVNQILLNNILPKHVKQFYLHDNRCLRNENAYHEECSSVAILFASIPNFSNFYFEDELNEAGRRCIQLLNEIVCDFDMLLFEKRYYRVEKIKTIGSTYMAACGLHEQDRSQVATKTHNSEVEQDRRRRNVVTLAHFATEMMEKLQQINKDALQELQLRIGLAVGRVMAGVVGSMRPQFDIWGDPVNVASRMDSTGVSGRIQVTEEVADIILSSGHFDCELRGEIYVKGKGQLTTYFLKTQFDEQNCEISRL